MFILLYILYSKYYPDITLNVQKNKKYQRLKILLTDLMLNQDLVSIGADGGRSMLLNLSWIFNHHLQNLAKNI